MAFNSDGAIARAVYEALDAHEFERAGEQVADGIHVVNVATGDTYHGRTGFLGYVRGWAAAFPDLRYRRLKIGGGGDRLVVEYEIEGTHTGPLVTPRGHIPQTGMEIQVAFCDVLEIEGDRIARMRSYFDSVALLSQLGLIGGTPLHAPERRAPLDLYMQPVDGTVPQRNKAIVRRFINDVFNRQSPGATADTCGQSFVWHGGPLGEARGLQAYQNVLKAFFVAFPDLELEILDTIAEGDRVVVRFSMLGTHLGHFQGIGPTFRQVSGGGTNTYRVEDGRVVEEWWQGDILALLQQMDAAPSSQRLST